MSPLNDTQIKRLQKALNEALIQNGKISQRELCKRLDITIGTMTKYLRGEVNPFDIKTRITMNLAKELKVTPEALYNYFNTGEYGKSVNIDAVESWIRSSAGQADFPRILTSLAYSQNKSLEHSEVAEMKREEYRFSDEGCAAFLDCVLENIDQHAAEKGLSHENAMTDLVPFITKNFKVNFLADGIKIMSGDKTARKNFSGNVANAVFQAHDYVCPVMKTMREWTGKEHKDLEQKFKLAIIK